MPFKYETEKRKDNRGQPYARKQLPNWNSLPILRAHCRLVQIFGLQNALKHFMSWEPVKFNFNYIIQKDEIYKSEELPLAVEAVSSAPIIFTTEDVIEETPEACPEEIPATEEIEMIEEDQSEELIEVLPSEEIHEDKIQEDIPEDLHNATPEMVSETEDIEEESEESSEDEPEEPEETGPNAKEKTAMELSSFLSSLRSTYKTSSW